MDPGLALWANRDDGLFIVGRLMNSNLPLRIGIVVIGRNEGERLIACLDALPTELARVYVDSASTDNSIDEARARGADVVELDMSIPFSAARARNEGVERLLEVAPATEAVQFLDGDTIMQPGWLEAAATHLSANPGTVVVAGRRRERFPDASWYNELCDIEWNTPVGEAAAVGGDALYRVEAFKAAGGFNPGVIAGEEPELCYRLRQAGGRVERLDQEMTLHDAGIHSFGPWWKRARRGGYALGLGVLMHGRGPERYEVARAIRALFWGVGLPALFVLGLLVGAGWLSLMILAVYGAKWVRVAARFEGVVTKPWRYAQFLMLANAAEAQGVIQCFWERFRGRQATIIEYK